ncbi:hypothetical protein LBA_00137 [Megavirus lba]|uniref:Uncharacterized protein n=1 Tax=Megavirus lba TaxID=1235314 RepID=L7Y1V4_9VIRU|nr:hypothetical protein LBA_00137 [Megavirus lba]
MKRIVFTKKYNHYYPINILNNFHRSFVTKNVVDLNKDKDENIEETNQAIISGVFMTKIYPNLHTKESNTESNTESSIESNNICDNSDNNEKDFDHYEQIFECDYDFF